MIVLEKGKVKLPSITIYHKLKVISERTNKFIKMDININVRILLVNILINIIRIPKFLER